MTAASVVLLVLIGWLVRQFSTRSFAFSASIEDMHLQTSAQLAVQALLPLAALATAATWLMRKRPWQTVAVFLTCAALLASLKGVWKWNFVDVLSKDVAETEVIAGDPGLVWQGKPGLASNNTRDGIRYSRVARSGRVSGLEEGWFGKLVKFESEALFKNGTVWQSRGSPDSISFGEKYGSAFLPRLGIELSEKSQFPIQRLPSNWTLFECEKSRFTEISAHRASIRGSGTFKLYQPYIFADLPAESGASTVKGRFRFQIESLSFVDGRISVSPGIRGIPLKSKGSEDSLELLLVNPVTQEFGQMGSAGGSISLGRARSNISQDIHLVSRDGMENKPDIARFLKNARLYIIGTRYGAVETFPFLTRSQKSCSRKNVKKTTDY